MNPGAGGTLPTCDVLGAGATDGVRADLGAASTHRCGGVLGVGLAAGRTAAVDCQVRDIHDEAGPSPELVGQASGHGYGLLVDAAALGAHQVQMWRPFHGVVRRRPVVQMGMGHKPGLVQDVERAVDRGQVDVRVTSLDGRCELVDGGVAQLDEGLQYRAPLDSAPEPRAA